MNKPDIQVRDIVEWQGEEYQVEEIISNPEELEDWLVCTIFHNVSGHRVPLFSAKLQIWSSAVKLVWRDWYTWQVIQIYDQFGLKGNATSNWKKPFATKQEAVDELERCTFPGLVQRVVNFRNGDTWSAGNYYFKWDNDRRQYNGDFWSARLESYDLIPDGKVLESIKWGTMQTHQMIFKDGSTMLIPTEALDAMMGYERKPND